jgi:hypothetical protein
MKDFCTSSKRKHAMKKNILYIALVSIIAFTSCDSNKKNAEEAQEKLNTDATELAEAKTEVAEDSLSEVSVEEWNLFQNETEAKIKEHEIKIAALKKSNSKNGNKETEKKIDALEQKNKMLENRLKSYEKVKSDWISFKRELSLDLDQLGVALKDFTVPSK